MVVKFVKKQETPSKSTIVTVRLDPRMRFGLNLLARKRHGTMSSVIEWALSQAIEHPENGLFETAPDEPSEKAEEPPGRGMGSRGSRPLRQARNAAASPAHVRRGTPMEGDQGERLVLEATKRSQL